MELFQGDRYARQLLRQHRRLRRDFWGLVLLQLLFWLTEGTAAVLLLRLLERPAGALLTESVLVWRLVQGVWYAVSLPLSVWCRWTVRLRVTQCSGMGGNGLHVGGRAVFLSLLCTLLRTAALLPAALFLSGAYHLARMGTAHAESAPWLFGRCSVSWRRWCVCCCGAISVWDCSACRMSGLLRRTCPAAGCSPRRSASCTATERRCWGRRRGTPQRCCPW